MLTARSIPKGQIIFSKKQGLNDHAKGHNFDSKNSKGQKNQSKKKEHPSFFDRNDLNSVDVSLDKDQILQK